jgi:hypothetical protein
VSDPLTPTEGARFLFERKQETGATAIYRAAIFTPTATHEGRAILALDGTATVELAGAPPELVAMLEMIAKLIARSSAKKSEDGMAPWPARVLRWRGPGRGE